MAIRLNGISRYAADTATTATDGARTAAAAASAGSMVRGDVLEGTGPAPLLNRAFEEPA